MTTATNIAPQAEQELDAVNANGRRKRQGDTDSDLSGWSAQNISTSSPALAFNEPSATQGNDQLLKIRVGDRRLSGDCCNRQRTLAVVLCERNHCPNAIFSTSRYFHFTLRALWTQIFHSMLR